MRKIIFTLIFGLMLIGAELVWYKNMEQQPITDAKEVIQTYKQKIAETQKQALAAIGNDNIAPGNQTLTKNKPAEETNAVRKKTETRGTGKVCNAHKCIYTTETIESRYDESEKSWIETKRTSDTKTEILEKKAVETGFKPRPECENPDISWNEFVKCKNEQITARDKLNKTH